MDMKRTQIELDDDLPQVFTALRRFLSDDEWNELASHYRAVDALGANRDPEIVREDGVSFNPRIARILSILITDGQCQEYRAMVVAVWATLAYDQLCGYVLRNSINHPDRYFARIDLIIENPFSDAVTACIRAALDLDRVRHLHISRLDFSQRKEVLCSIKSLYSNKLLAMLPTRLCDKVAHARSMQERRVEIDASTGKDAK
jgi:hypothetical protein